ncbi:MAG: DUF4275 family protein [Lysinibacillus sp.]
MNYKEKIMQMIKRLPEKELQGLYSTIERFYKQYQFNEVLEHNGVQISGIVEEEQEIKKRWCKVFTNNISEQKKKEIHFDQFYWHIFSYQLLPCLEGKAAMKAFDEMKKGEVYKFYQDVPALLKYSDAKDFLAEYFIDDYDAYICDTNFTWTYIQTHESHCGPYFYKLG